MVARPIVPSRSVSSSTRSDSIGLPATILAVLISSYFFVLPLGRYYVAGVFTDIRLYDLAFIAFFSTVGLSHLKKLDRLWKDRDSFFHWSVLLLYLVWMSLVLTFTLSGSASFLAGGIRAFRFTSYFVTAGYVIILADTPKRQKFLFYVIFINIVVQAFLGFAQGVNLIGSFWPDYWLDNYGERPVGTLSPHHKQMGVVMLLGIGLTSVAIQKTKDVILKFILTTLLGIIFAVPIFSGSRTAWLGFVGLFLAFIYEFRSKSLNILFLIVPVIVGMFWLNQDWIRAPLEAQIDERFMSRLDKGGAKYIYEERTQIYFDYMPEGVSKHPWVLLTGTGFQNISYTLEGATGAHNNYLQALLELGIIGFLIYIGLLARMWRQLRAAIELQFDSIQRFIAQGAWISFVAILFTMMVGESLWAQYSMFTLTGQIMALMALGIAPLYWNEDCASAQ